MTTDLVPVDSPNPMDDYDPNDEFDEVEAALTLSVEEFTAKKALDRDVVLFTLLRATLGELRSVTYRVDEFEEKVRSTFTPDGMSQLMESFMGGSGMGGLMGIMR